MPEARSDLTPDPTVQSGAAQPSPVLSLPALPSRPTATVPPAAPFVASPAVLPVMVAHVQQPRKPRRVARVLKTSIALLLLGAVAVGVFVVVRDRVGRSAAETTPSTPGSPDGVGTTSSPVSTQASTPAGPATVTTLPSTSYPMPAFRSAAVSESYSELDFADDGSVVAQTFGSDLLLDLVLDAASLTFTVDPPSGEAQPDGRYYGFLDRSYIYSSGTTFGAPWTRAPIKAETAALWLVPSRVHLAQEVFTPEVIADARNVSATEETVAGVPVTTYRFDLDLRVWFALAGPDAATQMSAASMDVFDVLDEEIRLVHLRVSIDAQGVVRLEESDNEAGMRALLAAAGPNGGVDGLPFHTVYAVTSISDQPAEISAPTDVVDG